MQDSPAPAKISTGAPIQRAPRFSIITSAFNSAAGLRSTGRSLRAQKSKDFEWIVIDGASSDDTASIVDTFSDLDVQFVSEPDSGIYSAWNKALPMIRGEWVLFLGAGDTLFDSETLGRAADILDRLPIETSTAYGSVTVTDGRSLADTRVRPPVWHGVNGPWGGGRPLLPCHQGVFQRATVFCNFQFDERCRISADNEVLLKELVQGRGAAIELMVARYITGGVSTDSANRLRMTAESIYINWKIGLFWRRPFYQAAVLTRSALRHAMNWFVRYGD